MSQATVRDNKKQVTCYRTVVENPTVLGTEIDAVFVNHNIQNVLSGSPAQIVDGQNNPGVAWAVSEGPITFTITADLNAGDYLNGLMVYGAFGASPAEAADRISNVIVTGLKGESRGTERNSGGPATWHYDGVGYIADADETITIQFDVERADLGGGNPGAAELGEIAPLILPANTLVTSCKLLTTEIDGSVTDCGELFTGVALPDMCSDDCEAKTDELLPSTFTFSPTGAQVGNGELLFGAGGANGGVAERTYAVTNIGKKHTLSFDHFFNGNAGQDTFFSYEIVQGTDVLASGQLEANSTTPVTETHDFYPTKDVIVRFTDENPVGGGASSDIRVTAITIEATCESVDFCKVLDLESSTDYQELASYVASNPLGTIILDSDVVFNPALNETQVENVNFGGPENCPIPATVSVTRLQNGGTFLMTANGGFVNQPGGGDYQVTIELDSDYKGNIHSPRWGLIAGGMQSSEPMFFNANPVIEYIQGPGGIGLTLPYNGVWHNGNNPAGSRFGFDNAPTLSYRTNGNGGFTSTTRVFLLDGPTVSRPTTCESIEDLKKAISETECKNCYEYPLEERVFTMPGEMTLERGYTVTVTRDDNTTDSAVLTADASLAAQATAVATYINGLANIDGTVTAVGNTVVQSDTLNIASIDFAVVPLTLGFNDNEGPVESIPDKAWDRTDGSTTVRVEFGAAQPLSGPTGGNGVVMRNQLATDINNVSVTAGTQPTNIRVRLNDLDAGAGVEEHVNVSPVPTSINAVGGAAVLNGSVIEATVGNTDVDVFIDGNSMDFNTVADMAPNRGIGVREVELNWDYASASSSTSGTLIKAYECGGEWTDENGATISEPSGALPCGVAEAIENKPPGTLNVETAPIYEHMTIWAEEGGALSNNNTQWSYGNGATGNIGIRIDDGWEITAISMHFDTGGSGGENATISVRDFQGAGAGLVLAQAQITAAGDGQDNNSHIYEELATPVAVPNGAVIGFRTEAETGGWADGRVSVRLRKQAGTVVTNVTLS